MWSLIPTTIQDRSWEGVDVARWSDILWWQVSDLQGIADRWQTTRAGLGLLSADPITMLFGVGLGAFRPLSGMPCNTHNTYLWMLVEMGIVGLLVLLGALGAMMRQALRAVQESAGSDLAIGIVGSLAALLVWMAATEGLYQRHLWLLFALAVAPERTVRPDARRPNVDG
jgi:hypothetical protein